jgi:hypothetical protein
MALELKSGFEIIYCSDVSYEEMTVEILYYGEQVLQINKDKGNDLMEVCLYNQYIFQEMSIDLTFDLDDFLEAIRRAEEMLAASSELSNKVSSLNTLDNFDIIPTVENKDKIICITYKEKAIAQIINHNELEKVSLHILTEYVKPELLSETKFLLNDFIEALSQAKTKFRFS